MSLYIGASQQSGFDIGASQYTVPAVTYVDMVVTGGGTGGGAGTLSIVIGLAVTGGGVGGGSATLTTIKYIDLAVAGGGTGGGSATLDVIEGGPMIVLPIYYGDFAAGSTLRMIWNTFGSSSQPITQTGLAVTDIEVYKGSSMTQRSSDSGYTLLDTDGTDLDGITGIHGISIDLSDNSDAGFYAVGNDYFVVINAITVNGQTVQFCGGMFSIQNRATANGVGDYSVTLTIRTTGGTPVSGVSVWVNSSNTRSGSVAGTKVTDTNGQVTFNLEYTTYYVFCTLSAYTFAPAQFTAASGSVSFTKDIATAVAVGSTAAYTDSFLTRAIADVRESLDEPNVSAKYTDARIIEHLEKAYILVLNEVNRQSKTPAVVQQTITIAANTTVFRLPYIMGSFYGLYDQDDSGGKIYYDGRGRFNPFGRRIWLEQNFLHIQSVDSLGIGTTLKAEWIPSGVSRLHNGTCTISADGKTVTLGATPNVGTLDTHEEAYAGSTLRILGATGTTVVGNVLQEIPISSYSNITRAAVLPIALDPIPTTSDGYIYYEIAPSIHKGMDMVVALYAAYRIMSTEGNDKRAKGILNAYRNEIRNLRLTTYYSSMPDSSRMSGDSADNSRYRRF